MPSKAELKKNLRALRERLQEHPLDLDARMRVARTLRLLSRTEDAVSHYAAVARYLSLAGHPLQAIAVLKELLQVNPEHEETLLFLAKLYARTRAADATNRGRVAVPILDPHEPRPGGLQTLREGIPLTSTGIWRAIAPTLPEDIPVVRTPDELGVEVEPPERPIGETGQRLSEEATAVDPVRRALPARSTHSNTVDFQSVPDADLGDDYEVLGQVTTGDVLLPRVPLFSSLSTEAFVHLSHATVFLRAPAGTTIFEEGEPGDSCVVISRGRARVSRRGRPEVTGVAAGNVELLHLGEGDLAGVFALMAAQTRQASLTAVTDLEYFEIDRMAVDDLVQKYPEMKATLARFFRERLILSLLASLPFFQSLDPQARQHLVRRFQQRDYAIGDELFFEGAENDGLWVVLEGRIRVGKETNGVFDPRAELGPGDYVGSLARVDSAQADLGAVASTGAKAAMLPHKVFSELLGQHQDIAGARELFRSAGLMVGEHVFAGNGTVTGHLLSLR